jgi:hypothetical protein
MQQVIELDETLAGPVVLIRDDYAVGPLQDIDTPEGAEARKNWWREILSGGDYDGHVDTGQVDDEKAVTEITALLDATPEETVWIWAAPNKHDICGYYWLMSRLKVYSGRILILSLNNLPFINEKGNLFYPEWLHVIPPREFIKAKKLARPITAAEFEVDPDEWTKICQSGSMVRLLEGGKKLLLEDEKFYDGDLKRFITGDFQKASRIINQFLSKSKHTTGDAYLLWRLKQIIQDDNYEVQGDAKKMKDFDVRSKTGIKRFAAKQGEENE